MFDLAFEQYFVFVLLNFSNKSFIGRHVVLQTVIIPHGTKSTGLQQLKIGQSLKILAFFFELHQVFGRLEHGLHKGLLCRTGAYHVGAHPVDGTIEKVETNSYTRQAVVAHDFAGNETHLIVEGDHVVGVPPNGATDVQEHIVDKLQARGNLIAHRFGQVKVAAAETNGFVVFDGIAQVEV